MLAVDMSGETGTRYKRMAKLGRPHTPKEIRKLVIQMARDNDWGLERILDELKNLGIHKICKTTIRNILLEHVFDPGPKRGEGRGPGTKSSRSPSKPSGPAAFSQRRFDAWRVGRAFRAGFHPIARTFTR